MADTSDIFCQDMEELEEIWLPRVKIGKTDGSIKIGSETKMLFEKPKFYQSFLDLISENRDQNPDMKRIMSNPGYRSQIAKRQCNVELIKTMSIYVQDTLLKPQRLISDDEDFYVAVDLNTNTYYVCFRNFFMADMDVGNTVAGWEAAAMLPHCMCQVEASLEDSRKEGVGSAVFVPRTTRWQKFSCKHGPGSRCEFLYTLYKSRNGYHAFCISHIFDRKSDIAVQMSLETMSDTFYSCYSYLRGWSVRLNRKWDEYGGSKIYIPIGDVYMGKIIDEAVSTVLPEYDLLTYLLLHDDLCEVYRDAGCVIQRH